MFTATVTGWAVTLVVIGGLIAFDLWHSRRNPPWWAVRWGLGWSLFYVAIAVVFGFAFALVAGWGLRCAVHRGLHSRAEPSIDNRSCS